MSKDMIRKAVWRRLLPLLGVLFPALPAQAQYESFGTEPLSLHWMQMQGSHYSVVYPQGMDSLARRYLYLFESSRDRAGDLMRMSVPQVPLILHPYALTPVSSPVWAPKRVDLFTTPSASGGMALNHDLHLALRNNVRLAYMGHYSTHLAGFMEKVLGQQSVALGIGFKPSVWQVVSSADAFVSDNTLSGLGRSAEYLMFWRAAFVTGDRRIYDRWHFGSYRNYMPDDKSMGYLLVSDIRLFDDRYYGVGDAMTIQMRDWWDVFGVWNRSFLEATGRTVRKHWRNVSSLYAPMWYDQDLRRAPFTPNEPLLNEPRIYTEYRNLAPTAAGLFATRSGYDHARALVRIEPDGVRRLRAFSSRTSRITASGEWLYWSEIVPDARYKLVEYSLLRKYNVRTRRTVTLTHRSRLFNPSVTPSGEGLWAVEYAPQGGSFAVLTDSRSGEERRRLEAPSGSQLTELLQVGATLYATAISDEGMALLKTAADTALWQVALAPQNSYLQQMERLGDDLCFVSDQDGVNCIYRYETASGAVSKMVHSRFGAFYPVSYDGSLYYADYGVKGHLPVRTPLAELESRPADLSGDRAGAFPIADREAAQAAAPLAAKTLSAEEDAALKASIDTLPETPYRRGANLFKVHSWAPFYASVSRAMASKFEPVYQLVSPGFTLLSQNELGTAVATLGYGWHRASRQEGGTRHSFHSGHFSFTYSGLYPVFDLNVDFFDRYRCDLTLDGDPIEPEADLPPLDYNTRIPSLDVSLRTSIPWDFSRGGWQRALTPELTLYFSNDRISYNFHEAPLFGWTAGLSGYTHVEKARRHLSPRLGVGGAVRYSEAAWRSGEGALSKVLSARLYGWLPGLVPSHSLKIDTYWWQNRGVYASASSIGGVDRIWPRFPRGYETALPHDLGLYQSAFASLDYGFTIPLGDITWPWLYYLMRIQVVPFADFAWTLADHQLACGKVFSGSVPLPGDASPVPHGYSQGFASFGADILVNAHFFRIGAELNLGLRVAFPYDAARPASGTPGFRTPSFSFLLSNNL